MNITEILVAILFAYIVGSIPTGYIIVKLATGQDIRKIGSGSTGATNVKRVMGKKWFIITLLLDALKGAIPVLFAIEYLSAYYQIGLLPVLAAVFVLIGHSRSVFLHFTGGKSVASGVGTILALNFTVGLIIAAIWAVITYMTRYVSVGSIIALAISPILMYFMDGHPAYVFYCLIGAIYIIWLHRANIQRLKNGEENKVR